MRVCINVLYFDNFLKLYFSYTIVNITCIISYLITFYLTDGMISGFTEIEGRYVLMLKNTYKKGVGLVHGSSNTGRSLYVEPLEIVEPTNEVKSLQAQLRVEEALILSDMCQMVSKYRNEIKSSTQAVAEIDIYRAKAKLGQLMKGRFNSKLVDTDTVTLDNIIITVYLFLLLLLHFRSDT